MSKRVRWLLVLIGGVALEGLAMGLVAQGEVASYAGVPGALGALIAVGAAILAGPLVGVITAIAGGVLLMAVTSGDRMGDDFGVLLWAAAAATAGVLADRYGALLRERDAAYEAERATRRESERARGRLARLQTVTVALAGALSRRDALEAVARHALEAVGARGAAIGLVDGTGTMLEVTYALAHVEHRPTHRVSVDAGVTLCEAYRTGRAVNLDRDQWRREFPEGYEMLGHAGGRIATRPLVAGTERLGALGLAFDDDRELEPAELTLLDDVVQQVALAVRRVRSYEGEHQIAATLQNSLLPSALPKIGGVELTASYVAGAEGMDIGGDWYDAVRMPDGSVCLAVGDVCGRGLMAAAAMGQIRSAWRALAALEDMTPARVLDALDRYVEGIPGAAFSTVASVRLHPATGAFDLSCAGHPPPLVIVPGEPAASLPGGRSMPLGVPWQGERTDHHAVLPAGATLMLYTDGLIERRAEPIDRGIQRLRDTASARSDITDLEQLAATLARLVPASNDDDVAMLFLRVEATPSRFLRRFRADPQELAALRHAMRRWLADRSVDPSAWDDLVLVCGEAASNAIEHGYLDSIGEVEVSMEIGSDGEITARVVDQGTWRPPGSDPFRGRGLDLMRTLMNSVDVVTGPGGTTVSMRRRVSERAGSV